MSSRVLIVCADGDDAEAQRVHATLAALGFDANRAAPSVRAAARDRVLVLWSRKAWGTPALRAAARRPRAVCVRLEEDAPPPSWLKRSAALPRGRRADHAWRRLLRAPRSRRGGGSNHMMTSKAPMAMRESSGRGFAIGLTLVILALVAAGAVYTREPAFAARVDASANAVYEEASKLAALAP